MEAALLGLEILNSWAQDTGGRLRFLLRSGKELEAGAGPPGRGRGAQGPWDGVGLTGGLGWQPQATEGPDPSLGAHAGPTSGRNKGTHSSRPTLSPLGHRSACSPARPPSAGSFRLSVAAAQKPAGHGKAPRALRHGHPHRAGADRPSPAEPGGRCLLPSLGGALSLAPLCPCRGGQEGGLAQGVITTVYRCPPTASHLGGALPGPLGLGVTPGGAQGGTELPAQGPPPAPGPHSEWDLQSPPGTRHCPRDPEPSGPIPHR